MSPGRAPWAAVLQLMDPPKKQLLCCCTCYSIEGQLCPLTQHLSEQADLSHIPAQLPLLQMAAEFQPFLPLCEEAAPSLDFHCLPLHLLQLQLQLPTLIPQSWDELCWVCPAEPSHSCDKGTLCKSRVTQPWLIQFGDQELSLTHNILCINYSIINKRFLICLF